jgi:hypothetical protein
MERGRTAVRGEVIALITSIVLASASAFGQTVSDPEVGRRAFQDGRGYYERQSWSEALDAFRRSLDALPSPNTRMYVGRCLRELGRPAEAWNELDRAAAEADASQDTRYARTAETARQESGALLDRVSFLVIEIAQPTLGVAVQVNGQAFPSDRLGRLYAVPAGSFTVDATAEGHGPFHTSATLEANKQARVTVTLVTASAVATTPPPLHAVTVLSAGDRGALPIAVVHPQPPARSPWRTAGIATMGAGLALGVVGIFTGLRAAGLRGDLDARCPTGCGPNPPQDVLDSVDEGKRMMLFTNLAWGAGAALVAGGAVMFFVSGGSARELYAPTFVRNAPRRPSWSPFFDASRGLVGLQGAF